MFNLTLRPLLAGAALSLLALSGCDQIDPLTKPYAWHPTDANAQNIAAQAANPGDLIRGRSSPRHRVNQDSEAVEHMWAGKTPQLITSSPSGGSAPSGGGS